MNSCFCFGFRVSGSGIRDSRLGIRDSGSGIQAEVFIRTRSDEIILARRRGHAGRWWWGYGVGIQEVPCFGDRTIDRVRLRDKGWGFGV